MKTSLRSQPLPVRAVNDDDAACCGGGPVSAPELGLSRATTLANQLRALADPTRLRLLDLLAQHETPRCVCELTPLFEQRQPTISHHLRILREAGLIIGEKRGTWSYYAATDAGRRAVVMVKTLL